MQEKYFAGSFLSLSLSQHGMFSPGCFSRAPELLLQLPCPALGSGCRHSCNYILRSLPCAWSRSSCSWSYRSFQTKRHELLGLLAFYKGQIYSHQVQVSWIFSLTTPNLKTITIFAVKYSADIPESVTPDFQPAWFSAVLYLLRYRSSLMLGLNCYGCNPTVSALEFQVWLADSQF